MRNEVGIKPEALLSSLTSNFDKKSKSVATADFSTEVSKKIREKSSVKAKAAAEQSGAASNPVKPEEAKDEEAAKEVKTSLEKADKPVENEDNVVAMQVQQIAINTLTVESKTDIPEIKLPNVVEGQVEVVEEESMVKAETEIEQKTIVQEETTETVQKFTKIQENAKTELPTTENKTKTVDKIDTEVQAEEEPLQVETVKKVDEKSKAQADSSKPDLVVNTNVGERTLDLGKVNIKVADAPLKAESPAMPEQLVDKILYNVDKGKHIFDIKLFPDNLGKLEIKMIFEKGTAQLVMTTHTDKAHKLLSQQLDAIKNILEVSTQSQSNVEVKESEKSSENFDRDNFSGQREKERQEQNSKGNRQEETESFVERLKFGLLENSEQSE